MRGLPLLKSAALFTLAAFLLSACQSMPSADIATRENILRVSDLEFDKRPKIASSGVVHKLSKAQEQSFLNYFNAPRRAGVPEYRRIANYLASIIDDFDYRTDTFAPSKTLADKSGNCLSLAMLTTSLAQLAGVQTAYQLMDSAPVFDFHGTIVEKGVHVRTLLLNSKGQAEPGSGEILRGIAMDFFPSDRDRFISNMKANEYEAMYYRNIANEALRSNDLNTAYWYARESLKYDGASSDALNTLAIVNRRAGNLDTAESLYLFALEHAKEKLTLLKNYRVLLLENERYLEAARIDEKLQKIDDPSPYHWVQLARQSFDERDYQRAIKYYQRSLELAPYLHSAHLGIAKAYLKLGEQDAALSSLLSAISHASNLSDRKFYKAKLGIFQQGNAAI